MFNRIRKIFKKWANSWIPYLWYNKRNRNIRPEEYNSYFTGWQYAAITAIADSVSELNFRLWDEKDQTIIHEYLDFITPELLQNIVVFMKMTGTAYVWKVMSSNKNKILWLNILLPEYVKARIDDTGHLLWWNYYENWNKMELNVDEVLVFAEFNPYQRRPYITRWYSPIQAIAMTVKWEREIEDWNYSVLTNDVPPWTVLTTDQWMTQEQVELVKKSREKNHTWAKNVWKLAILPFWIKPANIQASPKEMEFIQQQAWDRDKILAIYKVSKAILGIGEWVNVGNVKAFDQIFARRCLSPLVKKIARVFNQFIFDWIWIFEFVNVLPTDEEAVRQHYYSWGITRNEFRQELGYRPIKDWDVFIDWTPAIVEKEKEKKENPIYKAIDFQKIAEESVPRSEAWMIKRHNKKNERFKKYEKQFEVALKKIFDQERKDILKEIERQLDNGKSFKEISFTMATKYYALYHLFLKEPIKNLIKNEWERAIAELDVNIKFDYASEKIVKDTKKAIQKLAKSTDERTAEKIRKIIEKWNQWHLSPAEIKEELWKIFKELSSSRLETIVRTETIRYWTYAEQTAWQQSWVVKKKQRRTALDERVCEWCGAMHGKVVELDKNFFDQGDEFNWLSLDYEDVIGSPLHPNCRCDMIPIIENQE